MDSKVRGIKGKATLVQAHFAPALAAPAGTVVRSIY